MAATRARRAVGVEKKMIEVGVMNNGHFETAEDVKRRKEQYNSIMANANPLMREGEGRNSRIITASATIPLSMCYVDERYQGLRTHKNIAKLINKWDVRKLEPITVVPHPEEYRFAIVNGKGRSMAAPEKGLDSLTATILMDAPEELDKRLQFEAELFINQDAESENVKPVEKHLARIIVGDEAAIALDKMLNKYNVTFVNNNSRGARDESVLGSYPDTYKIAKVHGEKCLEFIFSIIENAGWNKEPNGYAMFVTRPLKEVWVAHSSHRMRIHRFLSSRFREVTPSLFKASGTIRYPKRDYRSACVLYLEDIVCNELGIEKRIYQDGDSRYKTVKEGD